MTFLTRLLFNNDGGGGKPCSNINQSISVDDALSDPKSELSRFLFTEDTDDDTSSNNNMRCIGSNRCWGYSLALEPLSVRSDRIVMIFEAYAIFAALFLGGSWVLYEWGISDSYGGSESDIQRTTFEVVIAIDIVSNILLAFFGSMLWVLSLIFSATNPNWVYNCRYMLLYCQMLFVFMLVTVSVAIALAITIKFSSKVLQIITFIVIILIEAPGMYWMGKLVEEEVPLEVYHSALWWRMVVHPITTILKSRREKLKVDAMNRARQLREKGSRLHPHEDNGGIYTLLKTAAESIDRKDIDITQYAKRLEDDLYTEVEHLCDEDVDILSRYMPRRLAKEVNKLVATKEGQTITTVHSS